MEFEMGMSYLNKNEGKPYNFVEKLPDGGALLRNDSGEEFYTTEQDMTSNNNWVPMLSDNASPPAQAPAQPTFEQAYVSAAIDEELSDFSTQQLRNRFATYYASWAGIKDVNTIYSEFVRENNVTDGLVRAQLLDVIKGADKTASTTVYPVMVHLTVDNVAKAASALLNAPESCHSVSYSKYAGYDLMVIGYPMRIREVLTAKGVYVDMMKAKPLPYKKKYSVAEASLSKFNIKSNIKDIRILDAYASYNKLPVTDVFGIVKDSILSGGIFSIAECMRSDSALKISIMNKEIPMTVENWDMPKRPSDSKSGDEYKTETGVVENELRDMMAVSGSLKRKASKVIDDFIRNYEFNFEQPGQMIADYYVLDFIINSNSSVGLENKNEEEGIVVGGYSDQDIEKLKKLKAKLLPQLSKTIQAVLSYACLGESKYALSSSHVSYKKRSDEVYVATQLFGADEAEFGTDVDYDELQDEVYSDLLTNVENYLRYVLGESIEHAKVTTPRVPLPDPEKFMTDLKFFEGSGDVGEEKTKALNVHEVYTNYGEDYAISKLGPEVVQQYKDMVALKENPPHDLGKYNYDLFAGTPFQWEPRKFHQYLLLDVKKYLLEKIDEFVGQIGQTSSAQIFSKWANKVIPNVYKDIYDAYEKSLAEGETFDVEEFTQTELADSIYDYTESYIEKLKAKENDKITYPMDHHIYYDDIKRSRGHMKGVIKKADWYIARASENMDALKTAFGNNTVELDEILKSKMEEYMSRGYSLEQARSHLSSRRRDASSASWSGGYGGENWRNIVDALEWLIKSPLDEVALDHAIDVVHNNGSPFNKVGIYKSSDYGDLDNILDTKTYMGSKYHMRPGRTMSQKSTPRYGDGETIYPRYMSDYLSGTMNSIFAPIAERYEREVMRSKNTPDHETIRKFKSQPSPEWYGRSGSNAVKDWLLRIGSLEYARLAKSVDRLKQRVVKSKHVN
jgi:hypothetical protein